MKLGKSLSLAAGAIMLAALLQPNTSEAAYHVVHASECTAARVSTGSTTNYLDFNSTDQRLGLLGAYELRGDADSNEMRVFCGIRDSSALPKQDVQSVEVYTYDSTGVGGTFGRAYLCASSSEFPLFSGCGPSQSASGSGYKTLTLSTDDEIADYTHDSPTSALTTVNVYMKAKDSELMQFRGFHVSD